MAPNAYVRKAGKTVKIGNGLIELGFDTGAKGALLSIVDKRSGWDFVRDADAPKALFRLAVLGGDKSTSWIESGDAARFRSSSKGDADERVLVLEASGFPGRALAVTVEVRLARGSALSAWRMRVSGLKRGESVEQIVCPVICGVLKVGDGVPGEAVATPRQSEGYVFTDPYPVADSLPLMAGAGPEQPTVGVGGFTQLYPGSQAMQLLLYYNRHAGLYLACHDSGMHVKTFACGPLEQEGKFPAFSIGHFLPAGSTATEYDTMVGVFRGDWHDGADVYKAWAHQQWWCEKKLAERDIADWMRTGFGVWQMSNYHIPKLKLNHSLDQIAEEVNAISRDVGVPLAALIFNFEGGGAWTGPAGFFPPREGEDAFRAAMQKLRDAGNHGFVYMPGGNWYIAIDSYDPPFDSREAYEKDGRTSGIVSPDGEVHEASWYGGWHSARLCPCRPYTRKMTADLLLGSIERGCSIVQIDNFPCGGAEACYGADHGHPPGYGPWYTLAWRDILSDVRRRAKALNPQCAIATEGVAETYIPYLDLYDQRGANMEYFGHRSDGDPMHGEPIPMFGYVYSGYIGAYVAAYPECNRPEVLYWTRCLGKALAQGVVPSAGRYWPEPEASNPVTLAFYKKVVRAAAQECWRYIMFGEMLKPPAIDVPEIEAAYLRFTGECLDHLLAKNLHVVTDRAVQHSAWRAPDETIGFLFVNVSREKVGFDVRLSAYGAKGPADADIITDGRRRRLFRSRRLPAKQRVHMAPLSVTLIEITPAAKRKRSPRKKGARR